MALNHEIGVQVPGPVPPTQRKAAAASMREHREAEGEIIDNWGTWGGVATVSLMVTAQRSVHSVVIRAGAGFESPQSPHVSRNALSLSTNASDLESVVAESTLRILRER